MTENKKDKIKITNIESGDANKINQTHDLNLDETLSSIIQELSKKILEDVKSLDANKCLDVLLKLLEKSAKPNRGKDNVEKSDFISTVTDEELKNLVENIVSRLNRNGNKNE
ncbi:MAG: hypothetical protein JW737_06025 [Acidobacteria bacterium]|nr:hypothetical protein [Acidobacteriota bacterium]